MNITVGYFIENFVVDGSKIRLFDLGAGEDVFECDTFDCWQEWEDWTFCSCEVDNGVLIINMEEN